MAQQDGTDPSHREDRGKCLIGLSLNELRALASCQLAQKESDRLSELVTKNAESVLCDEEVTELDELLAKADGLMLLKTRARYTLKRLQEGETAA